MTSIPHFRPLIRQRLKRADGRTPIYLLLSFKYKQKEIPTTLYATPLDLNRDGKLRRGAVLDAVTDLARRYERCLDDLTPFDLERMDINGVLDHVRRRMEGDTEFRLDFLEYWREIAGRKQDKSRGNYLAALSAFEKFMKRDRVDVSEITSALLRSYEKHLRELHGDKARAVSSYTSALAHVHRCAREEFNSEELDQIRIKNPFEYYKPPKQTGSKHRDISPEAIRMMAADRLELEGLERFGVDMFLLSFCLMGINCPDLYEADTLTDGVLVYNRHKTRTRREDGAEAHVRLEPEALVIMEEYRDPRKKRVLDLYCRYKAYDYVGAAVSDGLKRWCARKGIKQSVTLYSARHSWATIAYQAGVDPAIITDALVHVDTARKMDNVYVKKSWERVWEANRKVLDFVFHKKNTDEVK